MMNRKRLQSGIQALGAYGHLLRESFASISSMRMKDFNAAVVQIGTSSVPIVLLTGIFTGMVLALQTAYGLERFGAKNYVGNIAGLAFVRELGPVLTGLILCGRVGAGIAAEIASMVVTEQVDAMRALGANPIARLVTPRILAGLLVTPLLVVLADLIGIYGGLLVAVYELDITPHMYFQSLIYTLFIRDILDGLLKSAVFGFLLVSIACFKALRTRGGTEGVGITTTSAVVTASIYTFVADFFLTKLLLMI